MKGNTLRGPTEGKDALKGKTLQQKLVPSLRRGTPNAKASAPVAGLFVVVARLGSDVALAYVKFKNIK